MAHEKAKNEHASALSALGASKGGKARAKALTGEQRSALARHAAEKRWQTDLAAFPREMYDGVLKIGDIEIPCSVLENGTRVLSTRAVTRAVGGKRTGTSGRAPAGAPQLPSFLTSAAIKPFIPNELTARLISPLVYRPKHGGRTAFGYEATLLPEICSVILDAQKAEALRSNQMHLGDTASLLIRGFAKVGIIALIDEATGYQDIRARDALAKILEQFIARELRPYIKTFPLDFYKQIYRLRGWVYPPQHNRHNSVLGKLTNNLVYDRLAPGVRDALHDATPRRPSGRLKHKLFQRLTPDVGHPKLREHLGGIVMAMKMSEDWTTFMHTANRLLPKYPRAEDKHGQRSLPLP